MTDMWNGKEYGYDQIGATDPYFDITKTRYSLDPEEIINLNTPTTHHIHKRPYEQIGNELRCQELLINLRNQEDDINKLKSELKKIRTININTDVNKHHAELFHTKQSNNISSEMFMMILVICVVFIVLQMQIQETNHLIRELLLHGRIKTI